MSASTHSQERSAPSDSARATSLAEDDDQASTHQANQPISALAIEVHHGKFGCAVFLEEEQQLLLCEDLPCDFALGDQDQPESILNANAQPGQIENREEDAANTGEGGDARNAGSAADAVKAGVTFGQPSYGVVESCEHFFPAVTFNSDSIVRLALTRRRFVVTSIAQYCPNSNRI